MGKYLIVTGDFVKTGGMDRANHALASYLAARGDEVDLVTHRADPKLSAMANVTVYRVRKPLNSYMLGAPLLDRTGRSWARRLAKVGARVVVNGGNCRVADVNWVHYVHAAWSPKPAGSWKQRLKSTLSHRFNIAAERINLRQARVVIANSRRTERDVIERLGVTPERVETIYYGVDPERFRPVSDSERRKTRAALGWTDDRPSAVFVGALGDLRKGFDTLFAAWKSLATEPSWDARLTVVGAGALVPFWQAKAAEAGLDRAIEFLGFRRDVPQILAASDILISPTRYEAYGLNVHEALCAGLPAIVSASAGVAERYPAELNDWLLNDPEDPTELAERLRAWRERAEDWRAAAKTLSETLRRHSWNDMAAAIVARIEQDPTFIPPSNPLETAAMKESGAPRSP